MVAAGCIPESKRVQVPSAPRFYRSCADALTDGFRPQSGLVQRGVIKYRGADRFPPNTRHPECKRRISVHGVSDSWGSKYQSAGRHQTYSISESKRVQASSAPRFYRSCADALTDGFRPQSGLVQRGVIKYRGRQQTYRISDCKRGRRFAAGCIKRLCSLRSGGDGEKRYSRKQEGSVAMRHPISRPKGAPPL